MEADFLKLLRVARVVQRIGVLANDAKLAMENLSDLEAAEKYTALRTKAGEDIRNLAVVADALAKGKTS